MEIIDIDQEIGRGFGKPISPKVQGVLENALFAILDLGTGEFVDTASDLLGIAQYGHEELIHVVSHLAPTYRDTGEALKRGVSHLKSEYPEGRELLAKYLREERSGPAGHMFCHPLVGHTGCYTTEMVERAHEGLLPRPLDVIYKDVTPGAHILLRKLHSEGYAVAQPLRDSLSSSQRVYENEYTRAVDFVKSVIDESVSS